MLRKATFALLSRIGSTNTQHTIHDQLEARAERAARASPYAGREPFKACARVQERLGGGDSSGIGCSLQPLTSRLTCSLASHRCRRLRLTPKSQYPTRDRL